MHVTLKHNGIQINDLLRALEGAYNSEYVRPDDHAVVIFQGTDDEIKFVLGPGTLSLSVNEKIDNWKLITAAYRLSWFDNKLMPVTPDRQLGRVGNLTIARNRLELAIVGDGDDCSLDNITLIELPALVRWDPEYDIWTFACIADVKALDVY